MVVLTGSGISQESGIKTFRGSDGLWEGHRVEDVATPEAFHRDPELVYEFYNLRRRQLTSGDVAPNPAHEALAQFEASFDGDFVLVTQNVDDLHERAGSKNVIHMHGELLKARHIDSGKVYSWRGDLTAESEVDGQPETKERLRPHIVWFGETPLMMDKVAQAVSQCDLFVAIGTSGVVYPAAGLVSMTPLDCRRVQLNLEETAIGPLFDEAYVGLASKVVPQFFSKLS